MKKYKISCEWDMTSFSLVLLPTIAMRRLWNGFAIEFVWLVFVFTAEIRKVSKCKYEAIPFTGENSVIITKIATEEENDERRN